MSASTKTRREIATEKDAQLILDHITTYSGRMDGEIVWSVQSLMGLRHHLGQAYKAQPPVLGYAYPRYSRALKLLLDTGRLVRLRWRGQYCLPKWSRWSQTAEAAPHVNELRARLADIEGRILQEWDLEKQVGNPDLLLSIANVTCALSLERVNLKNRQLDE